MIYLTMEKTSANPFFSFILPAYKARYLQESIASILSQTYSNYELVIVNDKSPEDITQIVEKFNDHRIRYYVNEKNIGKTDLVAQWNYCLSLARGEYVILATDDDTYEPSFLETFIPLIYAHPSIGIFRSAVISINKSGDIIYLENVLRPFMSQAELLYKYMANMVGGGIPQHIFKRDLLVKKGGFVSFPCAWGSDDATIISMAENGIVSSSEYLVRFRWSDINISNDTSNATSRSKIQARLMLFQWLDNIKDSVTYSDSKFDLFFRHYIYSNFAYYKKSVIVREFCNYPSLKSYFDISKSGIFSKKDMISILYHYIKHKILR